MHEGALVASLLRQIEEIAAVHHAQAVDEIRLEIGLLAAAEPVLLQTAFGRLRLGTIAERATLVVDVVGLTCCCRDCQLKYVSDEIQFICPTCASRRVDVLSGDNVVLVSCSLQQPGEMAATT